MCYSKHAQNKTFTNKTHPTHMQPTKTRRTGKPRYAQCNDPEWSWTDARTQRTDRTGTRHNRPPRKEFSGELTIWPKTMLE